jgi:hypothetical protein
LGWIYLASGIPFTLVPDLQGVSHYSIKGQVETLENTRYPSQESKLEYLILADMEESKVIFKT